MHCTPAPVASGHGFKHGPVMGEMVFMSGLPALLASCAHFCGVASLTQALSPIVNAVAAPAVSAVSASMTLPLIAGTTAGTLMFSNTPLLLPAGSSEPEIAFNGHFMAITSLGWLFPFGTQLWTGDFGSTPNLQGPIDSALTKAGYAVVFGGGDADVDLGSTGTLHATTLVIPVNKRSEERRVGKECRSGGRPYD